MKLRHFIDLKSHLLQVHESKRDYCYYTTNYKIRKEKNASFSSCTWWKGILHFSSLLDFPLETHAGGMSGSITSQSFKYWLNDQGQIHLRISWKTVHRSSWCRAEVTTLDNEGFVCRYVWIFLPGILCLLYNLSWLIEPLCQVVGCSWGMSGTAKGSWHTSLLLGFTLFHPEPRTE